jgi:multiple sugar transport system permease protein
MSNVSRNLSEALGMTEAEFLNYKNTLINYALGFATLVACILIAFPVYWMMNTALSPYSLVLNTPPQYFPFNFTLENFRTLLTQTGYPTFYINSIILTVGVGILVTSLSTLAGYGLTRFNFRFKRNFARTILFGYMFPPILLSIPMYIIFRDIGLTNTYLGAILAISATKLPITIWIMWQFFQTVPESLEESAQMAGASRFRAFYEIALPIAKPGILASGTLAVAGAWNAFTVPKIILVDESMWPITVGLQSFVKESTVLWPQIMSSVALGLIPVLVFLYILHGNWETIEV